MDSQQTRLTRQEWEGIEVPVSEDEKIILMLIKDGYHNLTIYHSYSQSLLAYLKIPPSDQSHSFMYDKYMKASADKCCKRLQIDAFHHSLRKGTTLKKADLFRVKNMETTMKSNECMIYEFAVLKIVEDMVKGFARSSSTWVVDYYTLHELNKMNIQFCNPFFSAFLIHILKNHKVHVSNTLLLKNAANMCEQNVILKKHSAKTLFEHQKQLFAHFKIDKETPKLVLYVAPTATGKTLSPLGLSEEYRIIFICAARHVGLSLARSAITLKKKVALAFNCCDAEDIRLHYLSVKEFDVNKKNGGIGKVDNTVGDKVEIIICDLKSYLPAMYYMTAFNDPTKVITFWDEPTISLDYQNHNFHDTIHNNWTKNIIPNIVLSSATLPENIHTTIDDYKGRFGGSVKTINVCESSKSIPILNLHCVMFMPHQRYTLEEAKKCAKLCECNKTLFRYLDLNEIVRFIFHWSKKNKDTDSLFTVENYFKDISEVTTLNIKTYYTRLIKEMELDIWNEIREGSNDNKLYPSTIHITTFDAYTLTHGPTIYLADDVSKITRFLIKESKIPKKLLDDIKDTIEYNLNLSCKIAKLEKVYQNGIAKHIEKEKKISEGRVDEEMQTLHKKLEDMKLQIRPVKLPDRYIPNTSDHIHFHGHNLEKSDAFTSDVDELSLGTVMQIPEITNDLKILLLMGIGVFSENLNVAYVETVKSLANRQALFMVIATSDYIYGTNYQFCHGYIGKDLADMTREKCIQAMGRVGRGGYQDTYTIRFRHDPLIDKIFIPKEEDSTEEKNFRILFSS